MTSENYRKQLSKRQSTAGIISFLTVLANYACICISLIIIYFLGTTSRGNIEGTKLDVVLIGGGFVIILGLFGIFSLLGMLFGVLAVFRKNKKKTFGIIGLVLSTLNALVLLIALIMIYR